MFENNSYGTEATGMGRMGALRTKQLAGPPTQPRHTQAIAIDAMFICQRSNGLQRTSIVLGSPFSLNLVEIRNLKKAVIT